MWGPQQVMNSPASLKFQHEINSHPILLIKLISFIYSKSYIKLSSGENKFVLKNLFLCYEWIELLPILLIYIEKFLNYEKIYSLV